MNRQVAENPVKNRRDRMNPLTVVTAFMVTLYLVSNVMAVKVISVKGISLFDAGTITFPLAYMLGDVLTEIWGFKTARKVIYLTFACNVLFVLCTAVGLILPAPEYMEETNNAYATVFGYVPRIVISSLFAFLFGELSNAYFMEKIKKWTRGKHMWMRTIGSSMVGYIFDTVFFVIFAFGGTVPAWDIFTMIAIQYVAKLGIEALSGTPLAYAAVHWLKKYYNDYENNYESNYEKNK